MTSVDAGIGQRIFDLRIERDVQQGELARSIHINQSVLNRIEKGTRPARDKEIRALALFFEVSADYLLGLPSLSPVTLQDSPAAYPAVEASAPALLEEHSSDEELLLCKYRALDTRGRHAVNETACREYDYIYPKKKNAI